MPAIALEWMRVVLSRDGPPGGVRVRVTLAAFALYLNVDGVAWPSADTIASATGQDERTVRRAMRDAEATGWLRRAGHGPRGVVRFACATPSRSDTTPDLAGRTPRPASDTTPGDGAQVGHHARPDRSDTTPGLHAQVGHHARPAEVRSDISPPEHPEREEKRGESSLSLGSPDTTPDLTMNDDGPVEPRRSLVDPGAVRLSRVPPEKLARDQALFQAVVDAYSAARLDTRSVREARIEWGRIVAEGDGVDVEGAVMPAIHREVRRAAAMVEEKRKAGDGDAGRWAKKMDNMLKARPWEDDAAGAASRARVAASRPFVPPEPPVAARVVSEADWVALADWLERLHGVKLSRVAVEAVARRAGVHDPKADGARERVATALRRSQEPTPAPRRASSPAGVDVAGVLAALPKRQGATG